MGERLNSDLSPSGAEDGIGCPGNRSRGSGRNGVNGSLSVIPDAGDAGGERPPQWL
jgi:hypothetical protein